VFDFPDALDSTDALGELRDGTLLFAAFSSPYTWSAPFGRIVSLPDGTILLSGYGGYLPVSEEHSSTRSENERGTFCFLLRSRDGRRTWGDLSLIARHYNETTLLRLPTGALLAVMRSADESKYLATAVSRDRGYTWTAPKRITARSEHPGDLLLLADGRVLLTFGVRHRPYGVQAMLGKDGGENWDYKHRIMLAWDGDHGDLGYPISIQRRDGRIVTAYYIVYGPYDPFGIRDYTQIRPLSDHCLERVVRVSFKDQMRLAIEEARQSRREGNKGYGAVAVLGERLLAQGHDTAIREKDPSLHAEMNVLRQAARVLGSGNLSGVVLFSTCEPCPMCASLAVWANISAIVFGASTAETAARGKLRILVPAQEIVSKSSVTIEVISGVLHQECLDLYV
jgi:tRNA(adenine34) deaminase